MYEKIWDSHFVHQEPGQAALMYVDRHLMHEVTSPQAFEGLKIANRPIRNPHSILATLDHCVPTKLSERLKLTDPIGAKQVQTMIDNCAAHDLTLYDMASKNNGIIHVVVPEHGFVHPGMVTVCGDSHTATHGAFGALAFGIGTSEVEHVMATQCELKAEDIAPQVTWGTSPEQVVPVDKTVPAPTDFDLEGKQIACQSALDYMDLEPGTKITDIKVDYVFLGSCTNSRIEDFRAAAEVAKGTTVPDYVTALAVPGSYAVKEQAEEEGLDKIFIEAGWEWREPGCSMCLAMNGDQLKPGERCASTSNRNFEGRQGKGGRTHLVSPAMAAATAGAGHFVDIRTL
ncbi:UNVERIFIED_CONTAM: hypothetical protein GTU68_038571 [Idotea baltica]|nr:hypothetical protein [Idotea baltica]